MVWLITSESETNGGHIVVTGLSLPGTQSRRRAVLVHAGKKRKKKSENVW